MSKGPKKVMLSQEESAKRVADVVSKRKFVKELKKIEPVVVTEATLLEARQFGKRLKLSALQNANEIIGRQPFHNKGKKKKVVKKSKY